MAPSPLSVKPYRVLFTFFDDQGTKIHEAEIVVDGNRDLPNINQDATLQLVEGTTKHFGTVSDVQYYVEVDNNSMIYSMYVRCKNSYNIEAMARAILDSATR